MLVDYRESIDPKIDWRLSTGLSDVTIVTTSKMFIKGLCLVSSVLSNMNISRSYVSNLSVKGQNV